MIIAVTGALGLATPAQATTITLTQDCGTSDTVPVTLTVGDVLEIVTTPTPSGYCTNAGTFTGYGPAPRGVGIATFGPTGTGGTLPYNSGTTLITTGDTIRYAAMTPGSIVITVEDGMIMMTYINYAVTIRTGGGTAPSPSASNAASAPAPQTWTLRYDAQGGSCAQSEQSADNGAWVTLPAASSCTRIGYALVGWLAKQTDGPPPITFEPGGSTVMTGDNTLYAIWQTA